MAYLGKVKPVDFVKAKKKNLESLQARRSYDQEIKGKQEIAGKEAREFYESLIAESPSSQKKSSDSTLEDDGDRYCQKKPETGNKRVKYKSSKSKLPASDSPGTNSLTNSVHKPRSEQGIHLLLRLCQEGNLSEIRKIVKEGNSNLDNADRFGWNALMCAAYSGHVDVVKYLGRKHPAGLTHRNKQGQTVLELAQRAGHDEVVEALEQMERKESCFDRRTRNIEGCSRGRQPIWCEKCESDFKDEIRTHRHSTAHLFSCGHGPRPTHYHLPESNRGFQMMLHEGWDKEKGLGKEGEGQKFPVKTILKRDREGLGSADSDVRPRITHFKPFDTSAVKRPKKKKNERKKAVAVEDTNRARHSKSHRHKAMEIDFRMSFHAQP
eukprot:XP_001198233.2 PREDICTED: G patch domain and ankyrin repeat-containing protein 1-like [Strongylocentrotus purpuratus]